MEALIALIALTAMEIVLGIDNVIFIAVLVGRLPKHQQALGRRLGLGAAMATRILLLLVLSKLLKLEHSAVFLLTDLGFPESLLTTGGHAAISEEINGVTVRDLVLFAGGLFLVGKSVHEIHEKLEGAETGGQVRRSAGLFFVLMEIAVLDIVFSLDSVITAVGMARDLWVMIVAIVLAVGVMLIFAGTVSKFVEGHPTLKMLALSFLILIGVMLIAESIGTPVNKGYIYFAMSFALVVEFLNLRLRARQTPASTS